MEQQDLLTKLKEPFPPSAVYWKPGSLNSERTRALALAYADLRAYQNRLDEVCGMDWSVTYTPWGDRIVCHLTVLGVTRSSTGEADAQSERAEFAGTSAEAQAFKRACAMFGLGRYLYNLPSMWVDYDAGAKAFSERAKARLDMIVSQHYQRYMASNGAEQQPEPEEQAGREEHMLINEFDQLGRELYGEQWATVKVHNIERISGGLAQEVEGLTGKQLLQLIEGLKSLKRKRAGGNGK